MRLEELRLAHLSPLVGESFAVSRGAATVVVRLAEVSPLGAAVSPPGALRQPFRLIFRGADSPWFPQGTYRFSHPACGELEIFVVPLGPEGGEMRYEAIFT